VSYTAVVCEYRCEVGLCSNASMES